MEGPTTQRLLSSAALTGWQERRVLYRDFRKELTEHFNLSIGFGLFWTWVWMIFQTTLLSPSFIREAPYPIPSWVLPLFAYALTFSVLGFLVKSKKYVPHSKEYLIAIPVSMSAGIALCGILYFHPLDPVWLNAGVIVAAALVIGSATACLHVEWGRMMGELGPRKAIIHGILGTFFASIALMIIALLPLYLLWACAAMIPPLSMVLLSQDTKKHPRLYSHGLETKPNVPWKFLVTSFLQGLSFGVVQVILLLGDLSVSSVRITSIGFACSAMILLLCALFFKMDFNQLIYHIGFVVIAFGYFLSAFLGMRNPFPLFTHAAGFRFIDIMMWALCTYLVKQHGLSANWVFAWTTCALLVGQICGALTGNVIFFSFGLPSADSWILPIIMVFILLASSLFLSSRKNLQTGWGMVQPGSDDPGFGNFEMACKLVSRQFDLTAREEEIFILLAKGGTRATMGETLVLSKETIKTHIRNIYKKLDIHSQDEAFFVVEAAQNEFGFDEDFKHGMRL